MVSGRAGPQQKAITKTGTVQESVRVIKGRSQQPSISGILYLLIKSIIWNKKRKRGGGKRGWKTPIANLVKGSGCENERLETDWFFCIFHQQPSHTPVNGTHFLMRQPHREPPHPAPLHTRRRCTLLIHLNTIYRGSTSTVRRHKITWSVLIVSSTN